MCYAHLLRVRENNNILFSTCKTKMLIKIDLSITAVNIFENCCPSCIIKNNCCTTSKKSDQYFINANLH